jgi:hypothetical protein
LGYPSSPELFEGKLKPVLGRIVHLLSLNLALVEVFDPLHEAVGDDYRSMLAHDLVTDVIQPLLAQCVLQKVAQHFFES